jgi:hypothetical protein
MSSIVTTQVIDLTVIIIANLANLLLAGMFLARAVGQTRTARILGTGVVVLAVPLAVAVAWNALNRREWWTVVLPALLVVYCAIEFLLDYLLKIDFRHTRLLGPYLLLYYAGLMGMIGYAFLIDNLAGFVTLATYFVGLAATLYSFVRVGHGSPA